uniref:Uncharacterized protein n=1 Tax=Rhizophora mucronata TaxID=61149 RepID=A0A2P2MKF6_RHIMU
MLSAFSFPPRKGNSMLEALTLYGLRKDQMYAFLPLFLRNL